MTILTSVIYLIMIYNTVARVSLLFHIHRISWGKLSTVSYNMITENTIVEGVKRKNIEIPHRMRKRKHKLEPDFVSFMGCPKWVGKWVSEVQHVVRTVPRIFLPVRNPLRPYLECAWIPEKEGFAIVGSSWTCLYKTIFDAHRASDGDRKP